MPSVSRPVHKPALRLPHMALPLWVLLALVCSVCLPSFAPALAQTPVTSRKHHYTITPPAGWKDRQQPGGEVDLALFSPRRGGDDFVENLAIIVREKREGTTARQAAREGVDALRMRLQDFSIIDQGAFRLDNGQMAHRIQYKGTLDGKAICNTAYAVLGQGVVLTITGSALEESHGNFDREFDQAVRSITLADKESREPFSAAAALSEPDQADA